MSLSQLVRQLASTVDSPVKLFLDLPAKEADARFTKMFATLGKHPLVGVGALGGLVALFAYTKALVELDDLGLRSAGLLASGDLADFASRFAIPFVLLVVAFISLTLAWTSMLKADHRRRGRFLVAVVPGVVGIFAAWAGYFWWARLHPPDPGTYSKGEMIVSDYGVPAVIATVLLVFLVDVVRLYIKGTRISPIKQISAGAAAVVGVVVLILWIRYDQRVQIPTIIFVTAFVMAVAPVWPLLQAGKEKGVENDDRWQFALLRVMRSVSNAFGMLVVFSLLATALVFSASVSVLAVRKDPSPSSANFRVLESKQVDPVFINPTFVRLSSVWLVESHPAAAGPGTRVPETVGWWMVPPGEIACVRPATKEESAGARPKRLCSASSVKPEPPPVKPAVLPPIPENSIAAYAMRMFGCARESFSDNAVAWVVPFAHNQPASVEKGPLQETLKKQARVIPASRLALPTLQGLRVLPDQPGDGADALAVSMKKERPGSLWVLGFASTRGPSVHNLNLSERRAMRLYEALKAAAPDEEKRIKARGLSEDTYSGVFELRDNDDDRVAVAFFCRTSQ